MLALVLTIGVTIALFAALRHLQRTENVERLLKRHEYEPLVKHIWWH